MDLPLTARDAVLAVVLALATGASTWFITRWAAGLPRRHVAPFDSNQHPSDDGAAPEGGTIGVLAVALPLMAAIIWLFEPTNPVPWAAIGAALALTVAAGVVDKRGVHVLVKLGLQGLAVAAVLALLPGKFLVFQGLVPLVFDRIMTGLAWIWFINQFALMDGIDGLTGTEIIAIGAGVFTIAALIGAQGGGAASLVGLSGLVLAASAGGFLILNWYPARVRLSEGGTLALGFLTGWLLITLATWGYWVAALILPAYYLADTTITLALGAKRGRSAGAVRGEYFYQRAVARGWSPGRVARLIAGGNVMLIILAAVSTQVISITGDVLCLTGGGTVVALMLHWLARAEPADITPP